MCWQTVKQQFIPALAIASAVTQHNKKNPMSKNKIEKTINLSLNKKNNPTEILFISGAGISHADPCSFPLGNELHRILLQYYTDMTNWEIDLFLTNNNNVFENTVSTILKFYGNDFSANIFFNVLSELFIFRNIENKKLENDYHKFFRNHIQNGGKHLTVNLDQFIELDGSARIEHFTSNEFLNNPMKFNSEDGYLFKIHGDPITDKIGVQGFLLEVLKNGLPDKIMEFIDNLLNKSKHVVFIGYGGVDIFDINPYFESKPNGFFSNTSALWINYCRNSNIKTRKVLPPIQQLILSKFNSAISVSCSPEIILNKLFETTPEINLAHCNTGYHKEYVNIFRTNLLKEILDESNRKVTDTNKIQICMKRREEIRKLLTK